MNIFSDNKTINGLIFGLPIIALVVFLLVMYIMPAQFSAEQEKLNNERQIENNKQTQFWNSLDCFGKKEYLQDKDLRSSNLFSYKLNEQFFREYILECVQ